MNLSNISVDIGYFYMSLCVIFFINWIFSLMWIKYFNQIGFIKNNTSDDTLVNNERIIFVKRKNAQKLKSKDTFLISSSDVHNDNLICNFWTIILITAVITVIQFISIGKFKPCMFLKNIFELTLTIQMKLINFAW